jgi:hypothetical protein
MGARMRGNLCSLGKGNFMAGKYLALGASAMRPRRGGGTAAAAHSYRMERLTPTSILFS